MPCRSWFAFAVLMYCTAVLAAPPVAPEQDASKTLAVVLLHSRPLGGGDALIRCTKMLDVQLAKTPLQPYIFHQDDNVPRGLEDRVNAVGTHFTTVFVQLRADDYVLPVGGWLPTNDTRKWTGAGPAEYRQMGHWRLTYPFKFVRTMGHPYLLFLDLDSFVRESVPFDLLAEVEARRAPFAYRVLSREPRSVSQALAELARYYIVSTETVPSKLLWDDCVPPDMRGLYSAHEDDAGGWQRTVLYGNFVMVSIDFWFREEVQQFLQLVLLSGDHVVKRWNEQGVLGMVRLLFVKPGEDIAFNFTYSHREFYFPKTKGVIAWGEDFSVTIT